MKSSCRPALAHAGRHPDVDRPQRPPLAQSQEPSVAHQDGYPEGAAPMANTYGCSQVWVPDSR